MISGRLSIKRRHEKRLGIAEGPRRYDLPLNEDEGTGFLVMLVGLMSFLGAFALVAAFLLQATTHHWSSGLENKATIEIPAEKSAGGVRTPEDIATLSKKIEASLIENPAILSIEIMGEEEIQALIEPWIGSDPAMLENLPLPGLIALELSADDSAATEALRDALKQINPDIKLDTHESWLHDILKLASVLQAAAFIIVLMIGCTTVIAIAGAVRSRMAVHKADVELLHLMGASNHYIMKQFQRHSLIMALRGSLIGLTSALLCMGGFALLSGGAGSALLPNFSLHWIHGLILTILPALICMIAALTTRLTVLRVLSLMP